MSYTLTQNGSDLLTSLRRQHGVSDADIVALAATMLPEPSPELAVEIQNNHAFNHALHLHPYPFKADPKLYESEKQMIDNVAIKCTGYMHGLKKEGKCPSGLPVTVHRNGVLEYAVMLLARQSLSRQDVVEHSYLRHVELTAI